MTDSIVLVETLILVRRLLSKGRSRQQARSEDGSELHDDEVGKIGLGELTLLQLLFGAVE